MDWDTKISSSSGQWDWENLMLFPIKGSDIGRKAQWTTPPTNHHTAADAEMDNESVFSHSASAAFGYVSTSTTPSSSAVTSDCSINVVNDLCKVKTEILEGHRNVNFWDLGRVGGQDFDRGRFENGNFRGVMEENRVMKAHVYNNNSEEVENHNHVVANNDHKNDTALAVSIAITPLKGDAHLGLKLGKRTYFEDTSGAIGGGSGGTSVKAGSPITMFASGNGKSSANANASSASSTSAPPVRIKKHRGPSLANQTPRCQVEGCNKDLCGSKEYHRRHKVCDVHSKSAKVIVSGTEQRFCQQCSRFHALTEFDDGKRSCRRRLAGHNERRRKPPPDPMALNSVRFASSSYDGRRSGLLFDRSPLIHPRLYSGTVFDIHGNLKTGQGKVIWPRIIKSEDPYMYDGHLLAPGSSRHVYGNTLSRQNSDRLLHLLECSRVGSDDMHQSIHPLFPHSPAHHFSQPINVQSSSGIAFSDLEIASATPTNLSGVSCSGRALSLLSCQSWGSRPPAPTSTLDMTSPSGLLMDPYMGEDNSSIGHVSLQGMHNNFHSVTANTSESSTGIGSYETALNGPSWLGHEFKSPSDVRSKDVRRTINLMQRSVHSEDSQTQPGVIQQNHGPSMEFQLMRTYEPSLYDSQHM